jgi:pyrophosphatase PpaX
MVPRNPLPGSIEAVIFDYDDTLAETLPARFEAMPQTFAETGIWHKKPGLVYLYEGVRSLLDSLLANQISMGLLTSKVREITVEGQRGGTMVELEELGIGGHFMHIVGMEDVTYPKPHPEGLELILAQMGKRPKRTLVVGDSWSDVEAARKVGCWSCLTAWASTDPAYQLLKAIPDFIARYPSDVLRLVGGDG